MINSFNDLQFKSYDRCHTKQHKNLELYLDSLCNPFHKNPQFTVSRNLFCWSED